MDVLIWTLATLYGSAAHMWFPKVGSNQYCINADSECQSHLIWHVYFKQDQFEREVRGNNELRHSAWKSNILYNVAGTPINTTFLNDTKNESWLCPCQADADISPNVSCLTQESGHLLEYNKVHKQPYTFDVSMTRGCFTYTRRKDSSFTRSWDCSRMIPSENIPTNCDKNEIDLGLLNASFEKSRQLWHDKLLYRINIVQFTWDNPFDTDYPVNLAITIPVLVISLVLIVWNTLSVLAFRWQKKNTKSRPYIHQYSLLVSDSLICPMALIWVLAVGLGSSAPHASADFAPICSNRFLLQGFVSIKTGAVVVGAILSNVLLLIGVSADRFQALTKPMEHRTWNHKRRMICMNLIAYSVAFGVSLIGISDPVYDTLSHEPSTEGTCCQTIIRISKKIYVMWIDHAFASGYTIHRGYSQTQRKCTLCKTVNLRSGALGCRYAYVVAPVANRAVFGLIYVACWTILIIANGMFIWEYRKMSKSNQSLIGSKKKCTASVTKSRPTEGRVLAAVLITSTLFHVLIAMGFTISAITSQIKGEYVRISKVVDILLIIVGILQSCSTSLFFGILSREFRMAVKSMLREWLHLKDANASTN